MNELAAALTADLRDARRRTHALLDDLSDDELRVPKLAIVNPPLWEFGHVAWFQERWLLRRRGGHAALAEHVDALYDSAAVEHDTRWELRLPQRTEIAEYAQRVLDGALACLASSAVSAEDAYFCRLATFHEDMHGEAFVYTRQTLGYSAPQREGDLYGRFARATEAGQCLDDELLLRQIERRLAAALARERPGRRHELRLDRTAGGLRVFEDGRELAVDQAYLSELTARELHADMLAGLARPIAVRSPGAANATCAGDVEIPGGRFLLGASDDEPFAFDNERAAHEVSVAPFRLARCAVSQAEFAEFVEARGYLRDELWDAAGRRWRDTHLADRPLHWERGDGGRWYRRHYDALVPLEERAAMLHVNAHEADAWCRFAGRRLPSEAEWEFAASASPEELSAGRLCRKRRFPWGDEPPAARHAHLDLASVGTLAVDAHPEGDSAFGVRQMIGNVWEWTATTFGPYPGFVAGPYREYSEPWFGTHRVLRGGAFATRPRLLRSSWRNFYTPDRRDVLAGFRTCALR